MDLAFENTELRKICEDDGTAFKYYGESFTESLKALLADLLACENVNEIPVGNPTKIHYLGQNAIKLDVIKPHVIIFICNHPKPPRTEYGEVEWSRVKRIKIVAIIYETDDKLSA